MDIDSAQQACVARPLSYNFDIINIKSTVSENMFLKYQFYFLYGIFKLIFSDKNESLENEVYFFCKKNTS
jgi:hypothetical protein